MSNITITIDKDIARRILSQLEHAAYIAKDNYDSVINTNSTYKKQFKESMTLARENVMAFETAYSEGVNK